MSLHGEGSMRKARLTRSRYIEMRMEGISMQGAAAELDLSLATMYRYEHWYIAERDGKLDGSRLRKALAERRENNAEL
jgi:hypothetical protein